MPTAIIVMAAGASTRMGKPKQTLPFGGTTLLRHAVETALQAHVRSVYVVLGAREEELASELAGLAVQTVLNPAWEAGMGTTIRAGIAEARRDQEISSAILTLADQPGLTAETYNRIIAAHRASGLPLIAAQYSDTVGVPALFDRSLFDGLSTLPDEEGCKKLILANAARSMRLPCPEAALDIDTPADYERFLKTVR